MSKLSIGIIPFFFFFNDNHCYAFNNDIYIHIFFFLSYSSSFGYCEGSLL